MKLIEVYSMLYNQKSDNVIYKKVYKVIRLCSAEFMTDITQLEIGICSHI